MGSSVFLLGVIGVRPVDNLGAFQAPPRGPDLGLLELRTYGMRIPITVQADIAHIIRSPQSAFDAQRRVVGPRRRA